MIKSAKKYAMIHSNLIWLTYLKHGFVFIHRDMFFKESKCQMLSASTHWQFNKSSAIFAYSFNVYSNKLNNSRGLENVHSKLNAISRGLQGPLSIRRWLKWAQICFLLEGQKTEMYFFYLAKVLALSSVRIKYVKRCWES